MRTTEPSSMPQGAGSRTGWALFQWLFIIAAFLAASVTFIAISDVSPINPMSRDVQLLLGSNFVIIAILGGIVVQRYLRIRNAKRGEGGGRLARRFLLLFGLSAMIPAVVVSLFLWAALSRGFDTWFGERVVTLVEETRAVARENVEEFSNVFEEDTRLMLNDVNNAADGLRNERERFESYLGIQTLVREMSAAYVVDGQGQPIAVAENVTPPAFFIRPSPESFDAADEGEAVLSLEEARGLVTALVKIDGVENAYLYLAKPLDMVAIGRLRRAEQALEEYQSVRETSANLQALFVTAYGQIVVLVLLLSIRLALEAAGRITGPIGRLASAAHAVRDGDFGVRVPVPNNRDEVRALTTSFNVMTERLGEQNAALTAARRDAEDRRIFLETLLSEVSAGVIRADEELMVTLANRSALQLLDTDELEGRALSEIAPDFAGHALSTIRDGAAIDASLDVAGRDGTRHFRLKVTRDPAGGCVLTFDDATRLVNAQRQMAWRDVARRIAHEIRNPLTPIQLSAERLKRRYSSKIDEDDKVFSRCTDTILRQVHDIGRMVEEFSGFARMPKPSLARFDLSHLLHQVAFSQQVVSPETEIEVRDVGEKLFITGDERLLGQAVGNVVKNAAEAIERLPEDDVPDGRIWITLSQTPYSVEILIEDNGPGFPDEARDRLLEPYVTTREKGTGLGLAIVNRIIVDHGGTIALLGRPDEQRGAQVRIVLPKQTTGFSMPDEPVLETAHEQ